MFFSGSLWLYSKGPNVGQAHCLPVTARRHHPPRDEAAHHRRRPSFAQESRTPWRFNHWVWGEISWEIDSGRQGHHCTGLTLVTVAHDDVASTDWKLWRMNLWTELGWIASRRVFLDDQSSLLPFDLLLNWKDVSIFHNWELVWNSL